MNKYSILIASPPDREKLVAEIWLNDTMIVEISQEKPYIEIELFCSDKFDFKLPYEEFLNVVMQAKKILLEE